MYLPAADSTLPTAVLVLAWDETTPAVRALVEATQAPAPTVASILVMVPQAAAPQGLSAEEYLPLAELAPPPGTPSALPPLAATTGAPKPAPAAAVPSQLDNFTHEPPAAGLPVKKPLSPLIPPPLGWSAVRVLPLGSLSLAELSQRAGQPLPSPIWLGPATAPAAPYQGTASEPSGNGASEPAQLAALGSPGAAVAGQGSSVQSADSAATPAPRYAATEAQSQGADLEADLVPAADEPIHFELATPELPALLADFEGSFSAAQAGWPEALATLQQPAPAAAGVPTPPPAMHEAAAGLPARPVAPQYEAPDLNFKIIQYARFAVPVALAGAPYAAIYAPAWPTWLAAQELRQRTGWPLVLHVTTLAAGANESLDTATSWMAELQRQALRRADVVLAETPALAQRLRHELDLPAATVHTVPAADAAAIAQALHAARPRPTVSQR